MKLAPCAFFLSAVVASVNAHGFLDSVTIDGTRHTGNYPINRNISPTDTATAIRQIQDVLPVKGASNRNLNCGLNATYAPLVLRANPGSTISFNCSGVDYQLVRFAAVLGVLHSC